MSSHQKIQKKNKKGLTDSNSSKKLLLNKPKSFNNNQMIKALYFRSMISGILETKIILNGLLKKIWMANMKKIKILPWKRSIGKLIVGHSVLSKYNCKMGWYHQYLVIYDIHRRMYSYSMTKQQLEKLLSTKINLLLLI